MNLSQVKLWRMEQSLSKGSLKCDFLDIYLTTFLEPVISEIQKLEGSSSFSKRSKFQIALKMAAENERRFFVSQIIASDLVSLNCPY